MPVLDIYSCASYSDCLFNLNMFNINKEKSLALLHEKSKDLSSFRFILKSSFKMEYFKYFFIIREFFSFNASKSSSKDSPTAWISS